MLAKKPAGRNASLYDFFSLLRASKEVFGGSEPEHLARREKERNVAATVKAKEKPLTFFFPHSSHKNLLKKVLLSQSLGTRDRGRKCPVPALKDLKRSIAASVAAAAAAAAAAAVVSQVVAANGDGDDTKQSSVTCNAGICLLLHGLCGSQIWALVSLALP